MGPFTALYLAVYLISIGTVAGIFYSILSLSKKTGTSVLPGRLLSLSREEGQRLASADPVFLMHVSIASGVGLSILIAILDPILYLATWLRDLLLIVSVPVIAGLIAAFCWRVQRYAESKRVEKDILHEDEKFSRSSTRLQLVLMVAIALTTTELVVAWFPALSIAGLGLGSLRNALLIAYYIAPSVNLLQSFDRPLSAMTLPFRLSDVMEGRVDPTQIRVGASKLSELEEFERMSYDSCVEIGACESACPATASGRRLSPRVLVRKNHLLEKEKGLAADPMSTVNEEELWSCTSCGACVSACPVAVKHVDIVYDLRRRLVGEGRLDREKTTLLQNLTQSQNPYGIDPGSRAEWANGKDVATLVPGLDVEYLYWVGCLSSFDPRAQKVAMSLCKILKSAGVSFAILGSSEACTGDPARRLGEEGRYQELAYQNIQRMNERGVKKVVTTCPHCFNSLRNEYPSFGGNYEVVHHTQLISDLIGQGRIRMSPEKVEQISVTLHDACYAARYNNIFDEPRRVLDSAGVEKHEMKRNKKKTFCCGAGGSNYWYKVPQQKSIAQIRTDEAARTGARTIATECPFCLSMFEDSTRVSGTPMDVRDIAEIVADAIAETQSLS